MQEIWSVWELMGATNGATRGVLKKRVEGLDNRGWKLELNVACVGNDGHWPANMAFWKVPDRAALTRWLNAGLDDGLDETGLSWGKSRLYQHLHGKIDPAHRAFMLEYIVADDARALAALGASTGADLVLSELLAPWQGLAVWGSRDLHQAARRDLEGSTGAGKKPGIRQAAGWWAVIPAERDMV